MFLLVANAILCAVFTVFSHRSTAMLCTALIFLAVLLAQSLYLLRNSRTDPLTGLYNLRHLEAMSGRYRLLRSLSVYYFDLDHLKHVNDTFGHDAGDRLLLDFSASLRSGLRRGSCAFRIGGDEFLLIIPSPGGYTPPVDFPASWGSASGPGKDLGELIHKAEQQMYHNRKIKP